MQTKTLKDHLDLSVSVNASITNKQTASTENQGRSVLDAMYYYNPLVPVKNADGSGTLIQVSHKVITRCQWSTEDQYKSKEKCCKVLPKQPFTSLTD
ncbi:MAG: hypothetical protein ACLUE2_15435 [Bacteroides cellulosilyticus]